MLTGLPNFLQQNQWPFPVAVIGGGLLAGLVALHLRRRDHAPFRHRGLHRDVRVSRHRQQRLFELGNRDGGHQLDHRRAERGQSWVAWAFVIGALILRLPFQMSRCGIMLRASRDDDVAAKSSRSA